MNTNNNHEVAKDIFETVAPDVSYKNNDDAFILDVIMPGVSKDEAEITVKQDELIISGVSKIRNKDGVIYLKKNITPKKYYKSFKIGKTIDKESIKAVMKNGVLQLTFNKVHENEYTTKVEIQ